MEVASGEYNVDLEKAASTMMRFKPEPSDNGSLEDNVPTIPSLPSPMGKYAVTPIFFSTMIITFSSLDSLFLNKTRFLYKVYY